METFGLLECLNMTLALQHHLFSHIVNLRARSVIHHRIREHEIHVSLELERARDESVLDSRLDCLEVHRPLDDVMVVGRLNLADRVVKDSPIAVLRDLRVHHCDHCLEAL